MKFVSHEPPALLSHLIETIFHYQDFHPEHSIERVVPTGHAFLLLEMDGIHRHTYDRETLEPNATFQKAWVSGLHSNHLTISAHPDSEMFVIQFKAFGAYPFLQLPMAELAERVIPGDQFPGKDLYSTRERLCSAANSKEKFAVADAWLKANFDQKLVPPESLVDVVTKLQAQSDVKLNRVIDSFDGTQKHLTSQFKKYIGITPKQYQRVLRFNQVFVRLQGDQFLKWSDIAYLCGYSDQSHFIREFKKFSGFIPEDFLRAEFDDDESNFFSLDRSD